MLVVATLTHGGRQGFMQRASKTTDETAFTALPRMNTLVSSQALTI